MCDSVCEHRFCSCHTVYFILSMGDIGDHPTLRRALTLHQHSVAGTLALCAGEHPCDYQTIHNKSPSHTDYTAPCHCQATLLSKLLHSSLNLHFLFGAIFFSTAGGSAISCPENMENRANAQVIRRTLAIIQWESTTRGTSR